MAVGRAECLADVVQFDDGLSNTEPRGIDIDTLANLGPLGGMAGVWQGSRGLDVKPKADGPKKQAFVERIELQAIDRRLTDLNCCTACATTHVTN